MRGTLRTSEPQHPLQRIIPAYAGNTSGTMPWPDRGWDHPRVCGEHRRLSRAGIQFEGSSPRMRGTLLFGLLQLPCEGIIPAYAGNTQCAAQQGQFFRDHPRVCGEHATGASTQVNCTGSSPRMRGTPRQCPLDILPERIIPAYAGNTQRGYVVRLLHGDHPRVCGEHGMADIGLAFSSGSSPRMRGTRDVRRRLDGRPGIIPAYAGNTLSRFSAKLNHRDHPRVCGEHPAFPLLFRRLTGSSPRMRGTRDHVHVGQFAGGIIPAYAGNTSDGAHALIVH